MGPLLAQGSAEVCKGGTQVPRMEPRQGAEGVRVAREAGFEARIERRKHVQPEDR